MDFCLFLKFYFWTSTQDRQHDCRAYQSPYWDEGTHGHLRCSVVLINCPFSHIGFLAQNCLLSFYARHTLSDHSHLFNFSAEVLLIAPTFFSFLKILFLFSVVCMKMCEYALMSATAHWSQKRASDPLQALVNCRELNSCPPWEQ